MSRAHRVAEFFAGIGLVRYGLERSSFEVVWGNDVDPRKLDMYLLNFPDGFLLDDVRNVTGASLPDVDLATASFPCTDLSLAGKQAGLDGAESGLVFEFLRVVAEMGGRRPPAILMENVPSLGVFHGGRDLASIVERLNDLGYWVDLMQIDAREFVPQSRPRLFIVGGRIPGWGAGYNDAPSNVRPKWIEDFRLRWPHLNLRYHHISLEPRVVERGAIGPIPLPPDLGEIVERLDAFDPRWWDERRVAAFWESLDARNRERFDILGCGRAEVHHATAYRRTRGGTPRWEIRSDRIAGCLRVSRGGSSRQALVQGWNGYVKVRWLTPRETARLQGVPDSFAIDGRDAPTLYGFGDAVCAPVITWIADHYLRPLLASGGVHARD